MRLPINRRLLACCNFIPRGSRVADVGCDHGYLGIHLLQQGIARSVIASDVREGPLQCAVRNAEKYGVSREMSFYLSDGVRCIPRDFDVLVCAGMGGDTIISILEAAPWLKSGSYRMVLQCQSKTPMLRQYLSEHGWWIAEESVLRDGRFLYTVMEACYEPDHPRLTAVQTYFPPALLENPAEALPDYYRWVLDGLRIATAHRTEPDLAAILSELENDPHLVFLKEEQP